jgi:hypothetical protein
MQQQYGNYPQNYQGGYQGNQQGYQPNYYAQQAGWNQQQMQGNAYQQHQSPAGYQFQPTPMNQDYVKGNSDKVFEMYDRDRSGKLDMNEAYGAIGNL